MGGGGVDVISEGGGGASDIITVVNLDWPRSKGLRDIRGPLLEYSSTIPSTPRTHGKTLWRVMLFLRAGCQDSL